jgi:hypothetical protein
MTQPVPDYIQRLIDTLPPGHVLEIEWVAEDGGTTTRDAAATSTGSGASASGGKLSDQITGTAPAVDLGGVSGSGGSFTRDFSGVGVGGSGLLAVLLWCGIGLVVSGGLAWWGGLRRLALHLAAVGAALIVVAIYPAVLLWALLGAAAFALWPTISAELAARRDHRTLAAVTKGIERASTETPEAAEAVKAALSKTMDAKEKARVREVKSEVKP